MGRVITHFQPLVRLFLKSLINNTTTEEKSSAFPVEAWAEQGLGYPL